MENSYIWGKNAISKIGNKKEKTAECTEGKTTIPMLVAFLI